MNKHKCIVILCLLTHTHDTHAQDSNAQDLEDDELFVSKRDQTSRLDRGYLVIQHATAYEYLGEPTHARNILWLHLPIDINTLLNGPRKLLDIAANLQNTCDAALTSPSQMKDDQKLSDSEERRKRTTLENLDHKWVHVWQKGYKQTLPHAKAMCNMMNMTIPIPAANEDSYQFSLQHFMRRENITEILIESEWSPKDNFNRMQPKAYKPSRAFPDSVDNAVLKFDYPSKTWKVSPWSLAGYDDDQEATYAYHQDGSLTAYQSEADKHMTIAFLEREGLTDAEIRQQINQPRSAVICEKSATEYIDAINKAEARNHKLSLSDTTARRATIQLCYDTVDDVEVTAVTVHVRSVTMLQRHNVAIDIKEIGQQNNDTTSGTRHKRTKRFIAATAGKAGLALLKSSTIRKFGAKLLPKISGLKSMRNVTPGARRAPAILKKFLPLVANPLPMLLGLSGLGFNIWSHYRTNQKFAKQRKQITKNQNDIKQQATDLNTVTLEVTDNTENIEQLQQDMLYVQDKL